MPNDTDTAPSPDTAEVLAVIKDVSVLKNPAILGGIRGQLRKGTYEKYEMQAAFANLQPTDRVVELGSGIGVMSAVIARRFPDIEIATFEANPHLIPHISRMHAFNGLDDRIEVHNKIIVANADAPDTIQFLVRRNFLGSRMKSIQDDPDAETCDIPTIQYDDVKAAFAHNVLVMDIEGAEEDLLPRMDMTGIDLIMVELHPKIYGRTGVETCLNSLRDRGFVVDDVSSTGQVVTLKSAARTRLPIRRDELDIYEPPETYDFDPTVPLAPAIRRVKGAVLAQQPKSSGWRIPASVHTAEREVVEDAICWLSHRHSATTYRTFPRPKRTERLPGRWLFGGRYNPHFGHFLTESLSRLWALDHLDDRIDGVLFFSSVWSDAQALADRHFDQLANILDVRPKVKICNSFVQVDELVVPPQACGLDRLMYGSPEFRTFIDTHLRRDFPDTGIRKLYISRSGNFGKIGRGILGEAHLERALAAAGYTIFHPEAHGWDVQLAHYLHATDIVALDGSALHLVNFAGRRDQNLAIISRRVGKESGQLAEQARLFGIENVYEIKHMARQWAPAGSYRAGVEMVTELDFSKVAADLRKLGFLPKRTKVTPPKPEAIGAELQRIATQNGADMHPIDSPHASLKDVAKISGADGLPQVFF